MKYALTEFGEGASIMGLVWPQMNVNVRLDGVVSYARFLFVNKLAFTMVIAHIQILVHVNEAGKVLIVRYLFVHKIVTMAFVLHRMSVSVSNGRMNGEMDAVFHFSSSQMGILN
jgi:hypothetical protein